MDKPKIRPHNLSVIQPNTEDYMPANDGSKTPIVDQSDRITISVNDGKSGSSSSSGVETYAKSHD